MFLRNDPTDTLGTLLERVDTPALPTETLSASEVTLDVPGRVIDLGGTEVRLTPDSVRALGDSLDVPGPFLMRQEPDLQQAILSSLLGRSGGFNTYVYSDNGLTEVRDPSQQVIEPAQLVHAAARAIDVAAPVRDYWADGSEFRLDVFAPEDFERGIVGDSAVNDLSHAGVRITQDRKHNLAPQVQPFQYRLFCTNGMSTRHDGLKVDARGMSVDEVLAEFESLAEAAFSTAEREIASLYDMREERVDNPERVMLRLAQEAGLPARTVTTLLERIPSLPDHGADMDNLSMFNLINLMTNQANDPAQRRSGYRLALEGAAGGAVTSHAERCGACQSQLVR